MIDCSWNDHDQFNLKDLGNSGFVRVQVGEFGAKIGEELGSGEAGAENEENGEKGRGTDLASGDRMVCSERSVANLAQ